MREGEATRRALHLAISLLAAAAFVLTAGLKAWSTLHPPRCAWDVPGPDGEPIPDPIYPWLWWGGRLAIPVECALAVLLAIPRTRRTGAALGGGFVLLAAGTLAVLTALTGRDLTGMCGCFGPWVFSLRTHLAFAGVLLGLLFLTFAGGDSAEAAPVESGTAAGGPSGGA